MHPSRVKGIGGGGGSETERESRTYPGLIVAFTSAEQPEKRIERKRGAAEKIQHSQDPGWTPSDSQLCGSSLRNLRLHATYRREILQVLNCKLDPLHSFRHILRLV